MIFLDLDGTLTDPKAGITSSIIGAMKKLGLTAPKPDELDWAIGPALIDSFARLGAADPETALAHYREIYQSGGLFKATVYDGIIQALEDLDQNGHQMVLMTAKPHAYAKKITAHFELNRYLAHEYGPELDGTRNNKAELLHYALAELNVDPKDSVMVGDRIHDRHAAQQNQMPFIAVKWGYGSPQEHVGANAVCASPSDLPKTIETVLGR